MPPLEPYSVYILASKKNGTLYIGVTNNIKRRMYEHKNSLNKGFTSRYNINMLVFVEHFRYIKEAISEEKRLKKWNRAWKIRLIEEDNPEWADLAQDWFD